MGIGPCGPQVDNKLSTLNIEHRTSNIEIRGSEHAEPEGTGSMILRTDFLSMPHLSFVVASIRTAKNNKVRENAEDGYQI